MPQGNAVLDCSPIAAAGHVIPQSYVPISVSQFMDELSAEEDILCTPDNNYVSCISQSCMVHFLVWICVIYMNVNITKVLSMVKLFFFKAPWDLKGQNILLII